MRENLLDQLRILEARDYLQPSAAAHALLDLDPKTRLKRRAQFMRMSLGVGGCAAARFSHALLPAGVIAARNATCAANTP